MIKNKYPKCNNRAFFEKTSAESGTAFLFHSKQKKLSFEKTSAESGTAFLFHSK
jgi:hypothetical protein